MANSQDFVLRLWKEWPGDVLRYAVCYFGIIQFSLDIMKMRGWL
jgi:hypothetical protein